jgi:hypothetical protein
MTARTASSCKAPLDFSKTFQQLSLPYIRSIREIANASLDGLARLIRIRSSHLKERMIAQKKED